MGDIICCAVTKIHICTNPCKVMGSNCHHSEKCITLTHAYTWSLIRGNPILTSIFSHPPLPTNLIRDPIYNPLENLRRLIMIEPTQFTTPIQPLYNFINHTISQSLLPTPNTLNSIQNTQMGRDSCELRRTLSHIPWVPNFCQ